nr:putative reverse transcriptase domain-containing protein [Tanacetum cinerariifolium]
MDTIIDQQVAMDEALVPHAKRLRIRRSNFRLLSDIKSKESTLQLVYDVLHLCPFFKTFLMDNKKHIVNLESFRDMLHVCLRVPGQYFVESPFEEEILAFIRFLGHSAVIRKLTDVNINKLYQPWRSFAAIINKCLTGKSSGYDSLRLLNTKIQRKTMKCIILDSQRANKQLKATKAKSLSALSDLAMTEAQQLKLVTMRSLQQTHISQASSSSADEGTSSIPGVLDVPIDESKEELSWNSTDEEGDDDEGKDGDGDDDGEEGDGDDDDEDDDGEEGNDDDDQEVKRDDEKDDEEEAKNNDDEGNGEEDLGLNVDREGHDEEEEEYELYREVNINQGRGIQTTLEVEDSHVTLTPVNPDGMELIFETASQMDAQTPTLVAPLPMTALTLTSSTIATITTTIQAPTLPTTAPSTLLQDLPKFGLLFGFDNRLRTLEANFSKFMQTNQFVGAISAIPKIVHQYMDQRMNEAVQIILDTYGEIVTLKRRRDDDADKDEEPSAGPDRGSKRRREGNEPESASAPTETTTRSAGRDDDKLYKFKEGDFKRLRIQDIEDMLQLLVQGKLTNLTVKERFAFNVSLRMFTKSIVIQRHVEDLQLGVESYQKKLNLTIKAAPFEALYGRKCQSPICWTEVGEAQILAPELIQETTEKIVQIKERMQAASDQQKSYADLKRKPMEFQVGDKVLERVGDVAYKLDLPKELSRVHNTFHVSNLKKCHADEPLAVPLDGLHFDDKLYFVEELVEIMDRKVKRLKQSQTPLVKVRWNSKGGPEFTWERED